MSVFKKLAGLLFEEADAEVLAEDELEPIEIKEKPKKATASPVVEEEKTHVQMESYFNPHAAAAKEPKKEEKKFVTIDLEEKPKEKEAIVLSEEPLRVKKEELPQQEVEKYDLEEEINSVPLEDMIEKTPGEDGDDLMQISLFGESTPISSVDDASDKE